MITRKSGALAYGIWQVGEAGLTHIRDVETSALPADYEIIQTGGYLVAYNTDNITGKNPNAKNNTDIPYKVIKLDWDVEDPLGAETVAQIPAQDL